MKRCPSCNRTYSDPNLGFCVEDGTPLVEIADDESTIVQAYRPPSAYVPPAEQKRRRAWPWVLGIVGAFVLGVVGLMIAGAIFLPRMVRQRDVRPPVTTTDNTNHTETSPNVDAPPPTNEDQVLAQLTAIEHEWTAANLNADKQKLEQILADDYVDNSGENGSFQGKTQYLASVQRNTQVERWELDDLKIRLAGDRATLTGKIKYVLPDGDREFDFVDKFVWRNGRWQATGSEVKGRE
ncbi:MAG TPA: DUF4440 domain-containing protein [Pyrinomonadaceae bacterium]|nr:DUF4440 domain-containing protein [Pyrinomonadaceae bacterium]